MKIKNNTQITSRLTGRTTVQLLAVLVTAGTLVGTLAFGQSAKEIRGASPYVAIENEPTPKLFVDPPLPDLLDQGVVWIQYRTENVHIVPVFGKGALNASPRVGHLHVQVDDLPWWWADASDNNTIDLAGMPPGLHKVRIELVEANHEGFSRTVQDDDVHSGWPGVSQAREVAQPKDIAMSMNNKLKFAFRTMLVLPIACVGAFTGCSDFEVTGKDHRVTANLLTKVEQDHEKIDNPRVHPGQPCNQGWWPDP